MINLLPPKYKKYLTEKEHQQMIIILIALVFIFLISLSLILLSVKIYVSGEVKNQKILLQTAENEFQLSENQKIGKNIQLINLNFSQLNSFYQNQFNYADLLEKIDNILPKGIYLTTATLSYSSSDNGIEIFLGGFSPNRELLAEFNNALEKEPDFYDLIFPPSNWINPDKFSINFKSRYTK